ncbi:MAG: ATP-binding protein [Halioglobus sp.]
MHIEIANALEEVATVVGTLEVFCDNASLEKSTAQAAELALDELLTNIISYGYVDDSRHKIVIDLEIDSHALTLLVSDDGIAFNPFEHELPCCEQSVEQLEPGGHGIRLVKTLMDQCAYQRLEGKNIVTLQKRLSQPVTRR